MINEAALSNIPPIEDYCGKQYKCDGCKSELADQPVRFESSKGCVVFTLCEPCIEALRKFVVVALVNQGMPGWRSLLEDK